jgi:hypothetical protein
VASTRLAKNHMRTIDDFLIGSVWTYADSYGTWSLLVVDTGMITHHAFIMMVDLHHGTTWPILEGSRTFEVMVRLHDDGR